MKRTLFFFAVGVFSAQCLAWAAGDALPVHDYAELKFSMGVPAAWSNETVQQNGVLWESEGKASRCKVTFFPIRRDLGDVEKNLRAKSADLHWSFVEEPKRIKIDDCPAFFMLADIPGDVKARQLLVAVDEAHGTYLIEYVDLAGDFDREMIEKVASSFRRKLPPAPEPPPETGAPEGVWGCPKCGKPRPADMKFCGICGSPCGALPPPAPPAKKLVTVFGCPKCKKAWPQGQNYCGVCGTKCEDFTTEAQPESTPAPPTATGK